ncbi:uncharacterized protein JCM15063_004381 [Sporobolomyces koalae]|uniref:uncharacterized protein n=1 Tax=Sporobolomyces koalae TaxID=500713 RepID=UPI00316C2FDB
MADTSVQSVPSAGTGLNPAPTRPQPTSEPAPATIRPYDAKRDNKLTRYLIGAGVMEPSSLANRTALFKPVSLLVCAIMAHVFTVYLGSGYPAIVHNLFSSHPKPLNELSPIWQSTTDFLLLVPLFVGPPIIVLALFELRHRNVFEAEMRRAIGEEDLRNIAKYYDVQSTDAEARQLDHEKQPEQRKGFWVFEYDNRILGLVGLDGTKPGQPLDSVMDHIEALKTTKKTKEVDSNADADIKPSAASTATEGSADSAIRSRNLKSLELPNKDSAPSLSVTPPSPSSGGSPSAYALASSPLPEGTLHVRRFTTSMSFRAADIEDDLLEFVAKSAFTTLGPNSPPPARQLVIALRPTIQAAFRRRLEKHGWTLVPQGSELEVAVSGQKLASSPKSNASKLVEAVWPLSLEPRTMVLKRTIWEENHKSAAARAVSALFGGKEVRIAGQ